MFIVDYTTVYLFGGGQRRLESMTWSQLQHGSESCILIWEWVDSTHQCVCSDCNDAFPHSTHIPTIVNQGIFVHTFVNGRKVW